jgi:hypothetical protein
VAGDWSSSVALAATTAIGRRRRQPRALVQTFRIVTRAKLDAQRCRAVRASGSTSVRTWITFQAPDLLVEVRDDGKSLGLASIQSTVLGASAGQSGLERFLPPRPPPSQLRAIDRGAGVPPAD